MTTKEEVSHILSQIDERPFIQLMYASVSEVSSDSKVKDILEPIKTSVRCACLMDLYAETENAVFLREFEAQRRKFYSLVPKQVHTELQTLEAEVKDFFQYELQLRMKLRRSEKFTSEEITRYLLGKSSDNVFYGRLLELIVPEWNLTNELRIQTILFDIGKDIEDYEQDAHSGFPNILNMFLTQKLEASKVPTNPVEAIELASRFGISNEILGLATGYRTQAVANPELAKAPSLQAAINRNFTRIEEALKSR
ncbi:MAG: hypothetical protein A3B04_03825 [Candidatus Portnoybacteria bacterium RIFCSPLOWO2_02_FULL_39_11]|uniref:Uncharacterized protein n=1 Tax=Candidatus Portnoybacteria bacterium RIFCSPLOWO2_02_FULL_39_11 TaxID=1802001 RepID=A0A1G2FN63_9BACT|nr:MAG: hypothetical protein A3B04_03825 [Candidatus Portnoybacteria bacterium RIFCSPLOWO2_02_FULL_39_11]